MNGLSICIHFTTSENTPERTNNLLLTLERMEKLTSEFEAVLVTDHKTDHFLKDKLNYSGFNFVKVVTHQNYSRPRYLNIAVNNSCYDVITTIDADIILPTTFVEDVRNKIAPRKALWHMCYHLHKDSSMQVKGNSKAAQDANGFWRGMGLTSIYIDDFIRLGKLLENPQFALDADDTNLFRRAKQHIEVERFEHKGMFHLWHPSDIFYRRHNAGFTPDDSFILNSNQKETIDKCALITKSALSFLKELCRAAGWRKDDFIFFSIDGANFPLFLLLFPMLPSFKHAHLLHQSHIESRHNNLNLMVGAFNVF